MIRADTEGDCASVQSKTILRHHNRREDPFARIPKEVLDDPGLSFKAKGVLCYLLGKPDGWKLQRTDLQNRSTDGDSSIRSALKELRMAGYLQLKRLTDAVGRVSGWIWLISDSPVFPPDVEIKHVENPHLSEKEPTKNDRLKSEDVADATPPRILSKEDQLRIVKKRKKRFISADRFHELCEREEWVFFEYRPNLYEELCRDHFHCWNESKYRWEPILNLRAFLAGLNDRILRQ